jgi:cell division protein ZapA
VAAKNRVEVRISGKEYTIIGNESDEYIQKIALYVDRKMSEITKSNNNLSTSMVAVLTAVNLADELYKLNEESIGSRGLLTEKNRIIEILDADNKKLTEFNVDLTSQISRLQIELAKKEAELNEARNYLKNKGNRLR